MHQTEVVCYKCLFLIRQYREYPKLLNINSGVAHGNVLGRIKCFPYTVNLPTTMTTAELASHFDANLASRALQNS